MMKLYYFDYQIKPDATSEMELFVKTQAMAGNCYWLLLHRASFYMWQGS